jgi:hypothetical protein
MTPADECRHHAQVCLQLAISESYDPSTAMLLISAAGDWLADAARADLDDPRFSRAAAAITNSS